MGVSVDEVEVQDAPSGGLQATKWRPSRASRLADSRRLNAIWCGLRGAGLLGPGRPIRRPPAPGPKPRCSLTCSGSCNGPRQHFATISALGWTRSNHQATRRSGTTHVARDKGVALKTRAAEPTADAMQSNRNPIVTTAAGPAASHFRQILGGSWEVSWEQQLGAPAG